jgi:hypothetical protein
MNTRPSRYAAVLVAFVAVASPRQTLAADGDELFEPDIKPYRLHPEVEERILKARKEAREGDLKAALADYEKAYRNHPSAAVAAELGIFELRVGELVDAARHLDEATWGDLDYWSRGEVEHVNDKLQEVRNRVGTCSLRQTPKTPR